MNSTNRKPPAARGTPQAFNRQPAQAPQVKPVVAQLKTVASARSVKMPNAPPAFRRLATSKAAQPKMASGAAKGKPPAAPPVYRPSPGPTVLQAKGASPQSAQTGPAARKPVPARVSRTIQRLCPHGKANKNKCKSCQQSLQDRNVNKLLSYETQNKKTVEKRVEKVKELKTTLAHGKGNQQSNQSGKTKKLLEGLK